ncbi:hypothetical protein N8E89_06370 [Phyllobacterium sp. A18/5-2]|uniref:hypothetical protein n=1 Tax=Phyllobacterium sp. A18/5-2 TaxID=2978392 RepID=UPI0021C5E2C7|nr:hypothetical protein [Phyllobacterium sp. A18/5-2]UXN65299.1 hypothetical protein N8E89_06370 [Phyllobacterium sp. A18/5-2]
MPAGPASSAAVPISKARSRQNTKVDYPLITATCTVKASRGTAVASRSFAVPAPAAERPIETLALGTPVDAPVTVATKTTFGYRMITVPLTHAYDTTATAATRAAGWVRHYAMLEN